MNAGVRGVKLRSFATIVIAVTALWSVALDFLLAHAAIATVALLLRGILARESLRREVANRWIPWRALAWGLTGLTLGLVAAAAAGYGKWWMLPTTLLWGCIVGEAFFGMLLHQSSRATVNQFSKTLARGGAAGLLATFAMAVPSVSVRDASTAELGAYLGILLTIFVPICIVLGLLSPTTSDS